jgi:phosphatidylglycerol---prolipoprotein diacylglyceryl transferase
MNRIALTLGTISIYWYSLVILLGIIVASLYTLKEAKLKKLDKATMSDLIFYTIIIGLLGARVYYLLFNLDYYLVYPEEILAVWHGGLAIHGSIIFGGLFIIYFCKKKNLHLWQIFDIMAPALLIGQIIGRYGNFFNQEAYGPITTVAFLEKLRLPSFIIEGMYINGTYHQPTFLYESLWNLVGLFIILLIKNKVANKKGFIFGFYLIWYSVARFFIEILRTDSLMLGNIKMAMVMSVILLIMGVLIIIKAIRKGGKNG